MKDRCFSFSVPDCCDGSRLDLCVSFCIDDCSRSYASVLARNGDIYVNGVRKKSAYKVLKGDLVLGYIRVCSSKKIFGEAIPLEIVYEDSEMLVINKGGDIVVHPSPGHLSGTIVNAVLYICPDLEPVSGTIRPGIVHRLDKGTTGLLVVAKNSRASLDISSQFKKRTVVKRYLAVIYGWPVSDNGIINLPIGRHPIERKKMSVNSRKSRGAETSWKVLERYSGGVASLLEINIKTGRTHQIRVHCKATGHSIIGDPVYNIRGQKREFFKGRPDLIKVINGTKRQMLHAYSIELKHPKSKEHIKFEANIPKDMRNLLGALASTKKKIKNT